MRSLPTAFVLIAALAGRSLADVGLVIPDQPLPLDPRCREKCADISTVPRPCPQPSGTTKEDADRLDGPKFSWENHIWSTRGADEAVVEIHPGDCTLRTFSGRDDFCGVWIAGHRRSDMTDLDDPADPAVKNKFRQPNKLLEIPHSDGCCMIDQDLCRDIDWAQLWRIKPELRVAGASMKPPDMRR
ncbi:hypothetical protein CTA1_11545 [Colletotrichum tanaceti]|uniref:Secreted protein n=1 Tax=Colletotrichum tanaceti TaxID=1306861 RepID=A0A4U6XPZ5_9PEZI|nr:hypothetical protein CTA1_11545 [Colletotrichum tanaceti]